MPGQKNSVEHPAAKKAPFASKPPPGAVKVPRKRKASAPPRAPNTKGEAQAKLDALGIWGIVEAIVAGSTLTAIAADNEVSKGSLLAWLAADPDRSARAREARMVAGETWDDLAEQAIQRAGDAFELSKANLLAQHYRWRAKAVDPDRYGEKLNVDAQVATTVIRKTYARNSSASDADKKRTGGHGKA